MRVVFMGTPLLAAIVLDALADAHDVVGVVTRPDAVRGRGGKLVASPVKEVALRREVPVFERSSLKSDDDVALLRDLQPDVACVAACGIIVPKRVLAVPRLGFLNVHTSLLPRWRGAAPIERAILEGDEVTGVCIMRMEEGLDTGDFCRRIEVPVAGAYADELSRTLANVGAAALVEALAALQDGTVEWTPQAEEGMTYAEKIRKGELALSPDDTARRAVAKVHASSGAHPARASVAGKTLSVERANEVIDEEGRALCADMQPGSARFSAKRLFLRAADGAFEVVQVKPDGKKSMDARSFAGGIQGIKNMQLTWGRA